MKLLLSTQAAKKEEERREMSSREAPRDVRKTIDGKAAHGA